MILAVIAQEQMCVKLIDVKKAFFKGRLHKPIYIWAPDGHASFEKEIWSVLLPIYGLTISSRLFYQCVSEFFRSIGMEHFWEILAYFEDWRDLESSITILHTLILKIGEGWHQTSVLRGTM